MSTRSSWRALRHLIESLIDAMVSSHSYSTRRRLATKEGRTRVKRNDIENTTEPQLAMGVFLKYLEVSLDVVYFHSSRPRLLAYSRDSSAIFENTAPLFMIILLPRIMPPIHPSFLLICLLTCANCDIHLQLDCIPCETTFGGTVNPNDLATLTKSNLFISKIDFEEYEA